MIWRSSSESRLSTRRAISIALEHKGEIIAGVVYDPAKDEMYTAEKGEGAWLNDRRLRVSARRDLSEMLET